MNVEKNKVFLIKFLYYAVIAALLYISLNFLFLPLLPFVLAFFIASLVQKNADKFQKRLGIPKPVASLILVILFFAVVISLVILFVYVFSLSISNFENSLVNLFSQVRNIVLEWKTVFEDFIYKKIGEEIDLGNLVSGSATDMASSIIEKLSEVVIVVFSGVPEIIFNVVVTLVASCYIAYDYDKLKKFLLTIIKPAIIEKFIKIKHIFKTSVLTLLGGYIILMLITYCELLVGFFILGIKPAFLLSAIISLVDLLPILGTGTVLIPWSIFLLISGNKFLGIGIFVLYLVITLVRNFTESRIIGKKLGINPLLMLIAIFVGLKLFGILGLILLPMILIIVYEYNKPSQAGL